MHRALDLLADVVQSSTILDGDTVAVNLGQLQQLAGAVVTLCVTHKTMQRDARLGTMVRSISELTALHHWPSGMWSHSLSAWYATPEEALCETEQRRARTEVLLLILRQSPDKGKAGEDGDANDNHRAT